MDNPNPVPLPTPFVEKNGSTARRRVLLVHACASVDHAEQHILAWREPGEA
jgi:hypothetical protein